jgi:hypothetical protein
MRVVPFVQPCPGISTSGAPLEQPSRRQSSLVHAGTLAQQPPQSTMRAAPFVQPCLGTSTSAAPSVQPSRCRSFPVHVQQPHAHPGIHTRNGDTNRFSHDKYVSSHSSYKFWLLV